MKSIYIIEDDEILRETLILCLEEHLKDVKVVGNSGDGQEGLRECIEKKPDLAIVDIRLPEVSGLEILHIMKERCPETKIMLYTGDAQSDTVEIARRGDADGFMLKNQNSAYISEAISELFEKGHFYCEEVRNSGKGWERRSPRS